MIKNNDLKRRIIEISYKLKLGHIGSCLTAVDIIKEIYDIKKPDEKFVLSAGHAHLAHLVVKYNFLLEEKKAEEPMFTRYLADKILRYGIHCDVKAGCDVSTGSLGHGLPIAVGMALADRSKNVYCLVSDGELAEGSCYEALNIINQEQLDNIYIYVNYNGYAAYRTTWVQDFFADDSCIDVRRTDCDYLPFLKGQIGHYKVLTKEEYEESLRILS